MITTVLLALCAQVAPAQEESYTVGEPAPWVDELSWSLEAAEAMKGPGEESVEQLLVDYQVDYREDQVASYYRFVELMRDEMAIQASSQLEIQFDPSFESVTVHEIVVHRGGVESSRLGTANVQVLQRETSLDRQIYDGTHSLLYLLDDVRKGDVLEYSYTLTGSNPVFEGRHTDARYVGFGARIAHLRFRCLWPDDRPLYHAAHGIELEPTVERADGHRVVTWERKAVPAVRPDSDLPIWYDQYPWVQLSEYSSWAEVVEWGLPLFEVPDELPPGLLEEVERIRAELDSPAGRIQAALRFVQDDVRYLGIEMGPNSHRPTQPGVTFERRFGDCKDKTLLLVTMLGELGITAVPALVSTGSRQAIAAQRPSPSAFNHVICCVRYAGREFWLDPTVILERGQLAEYEGSWFGRALLLEEGTLELTEVPPVKLTAPLITVKQFLDLGLPGEPATMRVETTYRQSAANSHRYYYRSVDSEEMLRSNLNYYTELYPDLVSTGPMEVEDDEDRNVVVVTEHYRIPEFWAEYEGEWAGSFYPLELEGLLPQPYTRSEELPIGLSYPAHTRYVIEARLEEGWEVPMEGGAVDAEELRFDYSVTRKGDMLQLTYDVVTLAAHVPAARSEAFLEKIDLVFDDLGYDVSYGYSDDPFEGMSEGMVVLIFGGMSALYMAMLAGVVIFVVLRVTKKKA